MQVVPWERAISFFISLSHLFILFDITRDIGYQMLKNFGWKEGGGLGKTGDGMTAPIEVYLRAVLIIGYLFFLAL